MFLITKEKENASVLKYKKQAESEKARADALAQEVAELRKLAGSNGVQKGPGEKGENRRKSWIEERLADTLAEDPLPKDADSAKTHSWEVLVAVLLVLAAQALGYTAGLKRAEALGRNDLASGGGTLADLVTADSPDFVNDAAALGDHAIHHATTGLRATTTAMSGILLNEHGQATPLCIALVLSSIVLAPIVSSRVGARVMMVLTAAMPTAYVWLLPVASKLGFANSMLVLMSTERPTSSVSSPRPSHWVDGRALRHAAVRAPAHRERRRPRAAVRRPYAPPAWQRWSSSTCGCSSAAGCARRFGTASRRTARRGRRTPSSCTTSAAPSRPARVPSLAAVRDLHLPLPAPRAPRRPLADLVLFALTVVALAAPRLHAPRRPRAGSAWSGRG